MEKFSDRLRKIQKESGLSIKEIATLLNVPEKTAQKWFYGVSYPKPEVLEQLVNVIGANPIYLLTGQGPPVIEKAKGADIATLAAQALFHSKKKLQMRKNFSDATMRPS